MSREINVTQHQVARSFLDQTSEAMRHLEPLWVIDVTFAFYATKAIVSAILAVVTELVKIRQLLEDRR